MHVDAIKNAVKMGTWVLFAWHSFSLFNTLGGRAYCLVLEGMLNDFFPRLAPGVFGQELYGLLYVGR